MNNDFFEQNLADLIVATNIYERQSIMNEEKIAYGVIGTHKTSHQLWLEGKQFKDFIKTKKMSTSPYRPF